MATNSNRVQARIPDYQKWTIEHLVGIIGRNEGDVVARIIGEWFESKTEWLNVNGFTIAAFQQAGLGPKAPVSTMEAKRTAKSS